MSCIEENHSPVPLDLLDCVYDELHRRLNVQKDDSSLKSRPLPDM